MQTANTYFNLPNFLITSIDHYLATHKLEVSRSALLKLCLTLPVHLTPHDNARAIDMADSLLRKSNGQSHSIALRCKHHLQPNTMQTQQICRALIVLGLADDIVNPTCEDTIDN